MLATDFNLKITKLACWLNQRDDYVTKIEASEEIQLLNRKINDILDIVENLKTTSERENQLRNRQTDQILQIVSQILRHQNLEPVQLE